MDDKAYDEFAPDGDYRSFVSAGHLMDSKTSHLGDQLLEQLEEALHKQTSQVMLHDLAKIAAEYDPIDLAFAVTKLPPSARPVVYENLPSVKARGLFLAATDKSTRLAVFRYASDEELAAVIDSLPPDEAADIAEQWPERRLRRILDCLESETALRLRKLLSHDRHSAGRLMTNEFFGFLMDTTIGQVRMAIRDNPGVDLTRRIFVLDKEGELQGFVPSRNLIINPPHLPLRQVMQSVNHKVTASASREEVIDLVERYKIPALPVVEGEDRMVGVITFEDVLEVMEDVADETIGYMAGTSEDVSQHDPVHRRLLWRAPWLLVTTCAGLAIATVLDHQQSRPWYLFLSFFVPLINGLSGNIGVQCSTVLVRSMATGELSSRTKGDAIKRELKIGLITGSMFGVLGGSVVWAMNAWGVYEMGAEPHLLGLMVALGILGASFNSTVLGVSTPFLFARMNVDPAIASGPIVTAFNDTLSTATFCLIVYLSSSFIF